MYADASANAVDGNDVNDVNVIADVAHIATINSAWEFVVVVFINHAATATITCFSPSLISLSVPLPHLIAKRATQMPFAPILPNVVSLCAHWSNRRYKCVLLCPKIAANCCCCCLGVDVLPEQRWSAAQVISRLVEARPYAKQRAVCVWLLLISLPGTHNLVK